ncbi:hypothetical protein GCM10010328_62200 [Streptomyces rubiginosohelvolus]|uniref:Type II CBASS E2 protein domain-containing protein n=1 Tax=Streptomyces rubiginosohelvolus TaxID=67362 RepID=A0ABQ3CDY3_9ACTN|nr:hypothetical protein GCM10010328_62200 [Streptomyces pluricolorescens]
MTIATLLRHVGIDVPRYVTVDGEVILDASTAAVGVVQVAPHRFHGGEDPSPEREDYSGAWWALDPAAKEADRAHMAAAFPGFYCLEDGGDYAYGGTLNTGRGRFQVLVMPQVDKSLPSVFPRSGLQLGRPAGRRFVNSPHLYLSGALCVAGRTDWDPDRHNTATAVAWAAHWFCAYTEWRITGRWPTDGYGQVA